MVKWASVGNDISELEKNFLFLMSAPLLHLCVVSICTNKTSVSSESFLSDKTKILSPWLIFPFKLTVEAGRW